MNIKIKNWAWISIAISILAGCAFQNKVGLPEEIYSIPQVNDFSTARVGVFKFKGLSYAKGKGKDAALYLCRELERSGAFFDVIPDLEIEDMNMNNLINIALSKRYDLIITGELLYYIEGSYLQPSHVTEEIRVIATRGRPRTTLWHAKVTEIGSPDPSNDCILFTTHQTPAPSTMWLMKKNAKKIVNMILTLPVRD